VIGQKSFPQGFGQEGLARKVIIIYQLLTCIIKCLIFQFCTSVLMLVTSSAVVSYINFFLNTDTHHPIHGSDLFIVASGE
jgi:hypothetical protein